MSILAITALALGALGVLACFTPRLPSVVPAYSGMLCAYMAGARYIGAGVLVFWAIAAIIVIAIGRFAPVRMPFGRAGNTYVAVGAIAGTLLGYLTAPTAAAVIMGSAGGAVLGAIAFRSTPAGPKHLALFSPVFINFLCAAGLRAVVTCSICGITVAALL